MTWHYYNEIDPYAAEWLTNLMLAGHIPLGFVDTRSIEDVTPYDLREFTQCHFFAGIGGWPLALKLAGVDPARPLWTGSCPCQPFSAAGDGLGFVDQRHLWPSWFHLISVGRPTEVWGEQVASKAAEPWLDLVQDDMESLGHAFWACAFPAASVGARHSRERTYWFSRETSYTERHEQRGEEPRGWQTGRVGRIVEPFPWNEPWESALSKLRVVDDGLPRRVGATDAARNAIVPQQAAQFILASLDATDSNA